MIIETERLRLVCLDARQLELWLHDLPALESELGCAYRGEPVDGMFRGIIAGQLVTVQNDPENAPWHSFFWLIRKEDGAVIGSADFKAAPDERGETELGYGLGKAFEHNGYMTEAARAMCGWALGQPGVKSVIAETLLSNTASQRVLARCGFQPDRRDETAWWRLERGSLSN